MKTTIQYIKLCCLVGFVSSILSCSDKTGMDPVPEQESVSVTLSPGVRAGYSVGTLNYGVYIFQSPKGESNFRFLSMLSPFASGAQLDVATSDLVESDYRFLFIALPESVSEQTVITEYSDGDNLVPVTGYSLNVSWDDLRFLHPGVALSADYYYGVTEIEGEEIISSGQVNGVLDRLVGQMTYDIFKTNGTVDDPAGISSTANVTSVLDRVYQIDITYTGIIQQLMFDGTVLVPDPEAETRIHVENITTDQIDFDWDSAKVTPGEKSSGAAIESYLPEDGDESLYTGAVRIRGAYLLPATDGITVSMTFHYYDTTPDCGNSDETNEPYVDKQGYDQIKIIHVGIDECYPKKSIGLNLPQSGTLGIQSNYFTANKAGIPCNRVIEVPVSGSVGITTGWEASQAVAPVENEN